MPQPAPRTLSNKLSHELLTVDGSLRGSKSVASFPERYSGTLVVESSSPGTGTVFALTLPLSRTTSAAQLSEAEAG